MRDTPFKAESSEFETATCAMSNRATGGRLGKCPSGKAQEGEEGSPWQLQYGEKRGDATSGAGEEQDVLRAQICQIYHVTEGSSNLTSMTPRKHYR